jgi:glycosyltransferase involved in cell wall biosynthesis
MRAVWASDVGMLAGTPFLTGIQRVVLQLHRALRDRLGPDGLVATVVAPHPAPRAPHPEIRADPVTWGVRVSLEECDSLLGLDLNEGWAAHADRLAAARRAGTRIHVHVHDILPATHPSWFPPGARDRFVRWLGTVRSVATVVTVTGQTTAEALHGWWDTTPNGAARPAVRVVPLGADPPERCRRDRRSASTDRRVRLLTVGTVEPRKGHADVLDALDRLWRAGADVTWTVVGRKGWMVEQLARRLRSHPEHGHRLHWHELLTDRELDEQYATCDAVLVASLGEGFGLPVVEAAVRGVPLIVRDLPVLREIAGDDVAYFTGSGGALADRLSDWLIAWRAGSHPQGTTALRRSWRQVADDLVDVLGDCF